MNLSPPPIPWSLLAAVAAAAVLSLFYLLRSGADALPTGVRRGVAALRFLAWALLIAALLDPYWMESRPDPLAYEVLVLVDASRSMETRDLEAGQSRLDWAGQWLDAGDGSPSWDRFLDPGTSVKVRLFSDSSLPWNGDTQLSPLPGQTAIGDALAAAVPQTESTASPRTGAVLLLSDGIHLKGPDPSNPARRLAGSSIPVSVIGIGESTTSGDVAVRLDESSFSISEDESRTVTVSLENSFPTAQSGELLISRDDQLLDRRVLTLEGNSTAGESFAYSPQAPGVETLRAEFVPDSGQGNPSTNASFSVAEVRPRDTYRFLLMQGRAGWQSRLLRVLARDNDQLQMDTLIQVEADRFFLNRTGEETASQEASEGERRTLEEPPQEAEFYAPYDAILLDTSLAMETGNALGPVLENFIGRKGGGVLMMHSSGTGSEEVALPEALKTLFPVRSFKEETLAQPLPVEFESALVFADQVGGALFSDPLPELPRLSPVARPLSRSRAAREVARLAEGTPLLTVHAYGAGRAAFLGTDSLWRWHLSAGETGQFPSFWDALLSWLAVGGKPRLETPVNASVFPVDEPVDLDIRLLGPDYTPRMDANVSALLTGPDGTSEELGMVPSIEQAGAYNLRRDLSGIGTYRVDYRIVFPEGDELNRTAWFAVTSTSPETRVTAFNEKQLRDIARLTQGKYHSYLDWRNMERLPLSPEIPSIRQQRQWTRTLLFLTTVLACFAGEWYLRRKFGLR